MDHSLVEHIMKLLVVYGNCHFHTIQDKGKNRLQPTLMIFPLVVQILAQKYFCINLTEMAGTNECFKFYFPRKQPLKIKIERDRKVLSRLLFMNIKSPAKPIQ